jgi:hypothetical protein
MAIVYVQSKSAPSALTNVTSVSVTLTSTPTIGDLIVVQVSGLGTTLGLSDNKGNAYTRVGSTQTAYVSNYSPPSYYTFFYSIITSASSSFILTGTSNTAGSMAILAHEYSGVKSSTPLDTFSLIESPNSITSSSITTTNSGSLIYLGSYSDAYGGGASTVNSPFTLRENTTASNHDGSMDASADYI